MKYFSLTILFILLSNCSLNKDSKYWTEKSEENKINQKKLNKILKKTNNILSMSLDEYEIYIDDYTKKSKYPDISK